MSTATPMVPDAAPAPTAEPAKYAAVAPWWHTVIFIAMVAGLTLYQSRASTIARATALPSRIPIYVGTLLVSELGFFLYVWLLGLMLSRVSIREIIGGKWASFEDVMTDAVAAFIFWLVVVAALRIVQLFLPYNGVKAAEELLPQTPREIVMFVLLSVTAGFCEEFVFRGYLQRQFLALTQSVPIAIALQALVFGSAHLYQGWRPVVGITVYGALFGILAWWRKSLRPGMIQHAAQDSFSGIVGSYLLRHRLI